jgi:SAM-dependent methyltransferase
MAISKQLKKEKEYFINFPVFVKLVHKYNFFKFKFEKFVKWVFINERMVEIPFVLQNIPSDKSIAILDLGSTESSLPLHLSNLGYKVEAVDFRNSPYTHPNLHWTKADICQLPFNAESFDVVTCVSTLEHIGLGFYEDPQMIQNADARAMEQIRRVLKKGGILLLTVPYGVKKITEQQRIYDAQALDKVCALFTVKEKKFYASFPGQSNNYWKEIRTVDAGKIESPDGRTNCVCLMKLQ